MNNGHLIEQNELLKQGKSFASEKSFNATGKAELNAQADALASVRATYPYPPKNCEEAQLAIINIDEAMTSVNQNIAAGVTDKVGKRYLAAYSQVLGEFKTWVNAKKCMDAALAAEDATVKQELIDALNQEQDDSAKDDNKNNIIIFSVLGLLVVGALVIILKKKSA